MVFGGLLTLKPLTIPDSIFKDFFFFVKNPTEKDI
jgi:hypothetical protein